VSEHGAITNVFTSFGGFLYRLFWIFSTEVVLDFSTHHFAALAWLSWMISIGHAWKLNMILHPVLFEQPSSTPHPLM